MISILIKFSGKLTILMTCLFWLHTFVLKKIEFLVTNEFVFFCYVFNTITAIFFFLLLFFVSKYNPSVLGWVFILLSALKFLLFFKLIYTSFDATELTQKQGFFIFFFPYTTASAFEIHQLIKNLN